MQADSNFHRAKLTRLLHCRLQDKVTLKLFSAMVDANKIERAADLVDRLHNEVSFDLAIQIAGRHDRLADIIEEVKFNKYSPVADEGDGLPPDEDRDTDSFETDSLKQGETRSSRNVSPDAGFGGKSKRERQQDPLQTLRLKKQRFGA